MTTSQTPASTHTVTPAWYCCVMYSNNPLNAGEIVGCRGHNTWYWAASLACGAESAVRGASSYLVEGTCSEQPRCRGNVL
jgi:hypothetical protein